MTAPSAPAAAGDAIGWAHAGQGVIDFDCGQGTPGSGEPPGVNGHMVLWHYGGATGGGLD